jgi:predicted CoA-binding protein
VTTINQAATDFLDNGRIAVTGVSREPKGHGSNAVYQRLRSRGYDVCTTPPVLGQVRWVACGCWVS